MYHGYNSNLKYWKFIYILLYNDVNATRAVIGR